MLSNISVPLLGLVDTAILGHLENPNYLAAVAMGASLFTFVLWSFGFLRMGTTALIAQALGRQNQADIVTITQVSSTLALCLGGLLLLLSPWLIGLMIWAVDAVQDVTPLANEYLSIRFYAAPATLMNYCLLGVFIGMGNTRIPLILLVSANTLNAVLNYGFVYYLDLGSAGVAWASVLVEYLQLLAALTFVWHHVFKQTAMALTPQWTQWRRLSARLLDLNFNLFLRTVLLLFTLAFFMSQGAQHSAALLSANAILLNLLLFVSNALDGFAVAAESLVGRACGAGNRLHLHRAIVMSGQWSLATAVLFACILWLGHGPILRLLTSQDDVLELLAQLTPWLIGLPLAGFASYWLDGVFVGLADGRTMRNSLLVAVLLVFFPVWWLSQDWLYHGLWLAFYGFLIARALWLLFKLRPAINKALIG